MKELKIIFIVFTFTLLVFSQKSPEEEWQAFKYRYFKRYFPEEEHNRMSIFMNNLKIIAKYQKEDPDAEYGITKFTDLTQEEFKLTYLGLDLSLPLAKPPLQSIDTISLDKIEIPSSLDWRELGAVTPAKTQAICGSCWAFSAIGNIEGQYFLKQNMLRNLSEQELVDCDKLDQGCNGGQMQNAFTWLSENGGCEPSESYPYFGFENTCKINVGAQIVKVKGYVNISSDEDTIAQTLYTTGPLSTGINGNKLQFYKSGIFSPLSCSNELNHGVLFVGYGSEEKRGKEVDYWIIKNSWGADWGENGYFRIVKGKGKCGINLDVSTSILE